VANYLRIDLTFMVTTAVEKGNFLKLIWSNEQRSTIRQNKLYSLITKTSIEHDAEPCERLLGPPKKSRLGSLISSSISRNHNFTKYCYSVRTSTILFRS